MFVVFTHLALVWTGPYLLRAVYWLKYCGIDNPMKTENPRMNFVLKLLRLQNWSKLRPPAPAILLVLKIIDVHLRFGEHSGSKKRKAVQENVPTYAKSKQYNAATIGAGIEAKRAPNLPRMEKKIIKTADIWTTLLLPTCVSANKPVFSLQDDGNNHWILQQRPFFSGEKYFYFQREFGLTQILLLHFLLQIIHIEELQHPTKINVYVNMSKCTIRELWN